MLTSMGIYITKLTFSICDQNKHLERTQLH